MTGTDQQSYRAYRIARWLFVIAAVALWAPLSWHSNPNLPGTHLYLEFGVLQPLQAAWESDPDGFWFRLSAVRAGAFLLSVVLTAAAVIAAREMDRQSRAAFPATVLPGS